MMASYPDSSAPEPPFAVMQALNAVRVQIRDAALAADRDPDAIELVAVSKFHPQASVLAALAYGQHAFGENRVQEAASKFDGLRAGHPELRLHLIGPLQTNKALDALRTCDVIETLDRPRLADAIEHAAQKLGRLPALLVQVNIGDESQKAGIATSEADHFIEACQQRFGANLVGLMAIPPVEADPTPFFQRMASLAATHGLQRLSMGMSDDFAAAVQQGATSVRIGSAIFGPRPSSLTAALAPTTLASPGR